MSNIKIKCIDRSSYSFYITIENSKTVKDLKEMVALRLHKKGDRLILKKANVMLHNDLDLDTYEFSDLDCVEIEYI